MAASAPTSRVRVLLGRFEDLVSLGLDALLARDGSIEVVARDVELEDVSAELARHAPDVALLNFGSLPAPAALEPLRDAQPDTRLVVLASRPTAAECAQLLAFGATACLSKDTQARDIVNAIHLASRGLHLLPSGAASGAGAGDAAAERLTRREADVLELLQAGRTNGEIAHALSIGVETVRTHARSIYRKLGVSSRRDLLQRTRTAAPAPVVVEPER